MPEVVASCAIYVGVGVLASGTASASASVFIVGRIGHRKTVGMGSPRVSCCGSIVVFLGSNIAVSELDYVF